MRTKVETPSRKKFTGFRISNCLLGGALLSSILTASFYDPTLFNLLSPSGGIQNGLGISGALLGGTLLELFGVASVSLAWFIISPPSRKRCGCSLLLGIYYALVITLNLSILQVLLNVFFEWSTPESFILNAGYLGKLGGGWMLQVFDPNHAFAITVGILLFSGYRIFPALPFIPFALLCAFIFQTLIVGLEKLYRSAFPKTSRKHPEALSNTFVHENEVKEA